jgi:hypothetical protein
MLQHVQRNVLKEKINVGNKLCQRPKCHLLPFMYFTGTHTSLTIGLLTRRSKSHSRYLHHHFHGITLFISPETYFSFIVRIHHPSLTTILAKCLAPVLLTAKSTASVSQSYIFYHFIPEVNVNVQL